MLEVVVCRCGEDLSWTRNLPKGIRLTIYDKTQPPDPLWPGSMALPNVGREAHAWLHHLTERYHQLPPLTVFAQGRPFDHAPDFHRVVRQLASGETMPPDFWWLGFMWETDDARGYPSFVHWTKNPSRRELNLPDFFAELFGEPAPAMVRYAGGGQFVVSAKTIHRRSQAFYEKARDLSITFPDAAHAFERTWDRVFLAPPLEASLFGPTGLRLWKPVRRKSPSPGEG
ncbi:MAG: DUF3431 domain-containing protein [Verrucomicrobia bacterium]|nr:DUF3431 domain-containing protein [Verrucomicrobiota bacterium]